jgi:group I intron endonuclease
VSLIDLKPASASLSEARELKGISGVYALFNYNTGKVYVGSSKDIGKRIRRHFHDLKSGKHFSHHIQKSWKAHGEQAFSFCLVEETPVENITVREQFFLDLWQASDSKKGYNLSPTAASVRGVKRSEKTLNHHSTRMKKIWADANNPVRAKLLASLTSPESIAGRSKIMKSRWETHRKNGTLVTQLTGSIHSPEAHHKRLVKFRMSGQADRFKELNEQRTIRVTWTHPIHGDFFGSRTELSQKFPDQRLTSSALDRVRRSENTHHKGWQLKE